MLADCSHERDVLEAVVAGRWPAAVDTSLRGHVDECETCREVLAVALAFSADVEASGADIRVPSSAHVWWRAQMRARQEAIAAVARPIAVTQSLAATAVGVFALSGLVAWRDTVWSAMRRPVELVTASVAGQAGTGLVEAGAATGLDPALALTVGAVLIAAPAVIYLAIVHERS